jgi:hypothetical protein
MDDRTAAASLNPHLMRLVLVTMAGTGQMAAATTGRTVIANAGPSIPLTTSRQRNGCVKVTPAVGHESHQVKITMV